LWCRPQAMVATILERYGPLQGFYGQDTNGQKKWNWKFIR
jgi:hypothetical protein